MHTIDRLTDHLQNAWISIVVRDSTLVPVRAETTLRAGGDVVVLGGADVGDALATTFSGKAAERPPAAP